MEEVAAGKEYSVSISNGHLSAVEIKGRKIITASIQNIPTFKVGSDIPKNGSILILDGHRIVYVKIKNGPVFCDSRYDYCEIHP